MDKAAFTEAMTKKIEGLVGDIRFSQDIIDRGTRLTDAIESVVPEGDDGWDETVAQHYMELLTEETLFNGAEVINGVAVPTENPPEDVLEESIKQVTANISGLPVSTRVVIATTGRITNDVLKARPA